MSAPYEQDHSQAPANPEHKKKKRGYASQAFEFGSGSNAQPTPQGYGGVYAQQQPAGQSPQPAYGMPMQSQPAAMYGAPQQSPGVPAQPGYGADYGYPAQQPAQQQVPAIPADQGMAGITGGMAGMQIGAAQTQPQPMPPPQQARIALNQLHTTDLIQQPFNVAELEMPPPPLVLPPNVRFSDKPSVTLTLMIYAPLVKCYFLP